MVFCSTCGSVFLFMYHQKSLLLQEMGTNTEAHIQRVRDCGTLNPKGMSPSDPFPYSYGRGRGRGSVGARGYRGHQGIKDF